MSNSNSAAEIAKALSILKKYDLKETEQLLKKEASSILSVSQSQQEAETIPSEFTAKSDDDFNLCIERFVELLRFIDSSLDTHKAELSGVLYPVFVHLYLRLVSTDNSNEAIAFYNRFASRLPPYHNDSCHLTELRSVTNSHQVPASPVLEGFRSGQYVVCMSRDSHQLFKQFLIERSGQLIDSAMEHIIIEELDGPPRKRLLAESRRGAFLGESRRDANKVKVLYSVAKDSIEMLLAQEELSNDGDDEGSKKKKLKRDPAAGKKSKPDPNAPPADRIPLPELRDSDRAERKAKLKELQRRARLSPNCLPSCCMYTAHNCTDEPVTACEISEDGTLLCCGTAHSVVKVWSLAGRNGLSELRSAAELDKLDASDDHVHLKMLSDKHSHCRLLVGHSAPVYSVSLSPNKQLVVSGSGDTTIRLWSLQLWSCLIVLRGHHEPVWSVRFSPLGHYFASGGADWTARVWATDHPSPLRVLTGHLSDVDCVQFHPNGNYVATGCSDGIVRLFDMLNARCVRAFTGHKGAPTCALFSNCGRFLLSGCTAGILCAWDIATGHQAAHIADAHNGTVHTIGVCRDGVLLATGGADCSVRLWDLPKLFQQYQQNVTNNGSPISAAVLDPSVCYLKSFYTKRTPVLHLQYSRTNVLLAAGYFDTPTDS